MTVVLRVDTVESCRSLSSRSPGVSVYGSRAIHIEVEAAILSAARGSLMELAWMIEAGSGQRVGVNPDHVLMLRIVEPGSDR